MALADQDLASENAQLRARVEALELEIAELRASTVATVASAQETLYWFERWGVDFNSLMARPQAEQLRKIVRALRSVYRSLLKAKRSIIK
jgi:hypothetical protein